MNNALPAIDPRVWGADVWAALRLIFDPAKGLLKGQSVYAVALDVAGALPCPTCGADARAFVTSNKHLFTEEAYQCGVTLTAFCTLRERVALKTGQHTNTLFTGTPCAQRGITFLHNWSGGRLDTTLDKALGCAHNKSLA